MTLILPNFTTVTTQGTYGSPESRSISKKT